MRPILVWTREKALLPEKNYPKVYQQFHFSYLDPAANLPSSEHVLLLDEHVLHERVNDLRNYTQNSHSLVLPVVALANNQVTLEAEGLCFQILERTPEEEILLRTLRNASHSLDSELQLKAAQAARETRARELEELHAIGIALSSERNHDQLLNLILTKAREITCADAGSLFLVEKIKENIEPENRNDVGLEEDNVKAHCLRFILSQNDSREFNHKEQFLAIAPDSIAGYVAQTGETLNLKDAYKPLKEKLFTINRKFDESTGYRTRSMLVVPMQNKKGERIGVLQLLNKKTAAAITLNSQEDFTHYVLPFSEFDEQLVRSLASQAAVSVNNNRLYQQIEKLFGHFVDAAVKTIESRDPTTQGHSRRVADLTTELARVTNRAERGPYANFTLRSEQIKELRYAALLHDFGKVGVKEKVLLKATKLLHGELRVIEQRFKTIRSTVEAKHLRQLLDRLIHSDAGPEELQDMEAKLVRELADVDDALAAVKQANIPTVTHFSNFDKLLDVGQRTYTDVDGSKQRFLEPEELESLTITRGTLTGAERQQINEHVRHTFEFLNKIPWTSDLQNVPRLARSHHEKLDGSGYPQQLTAKDIPPQTRMMTISDIYDALADQDRPYKPAVPTEKALGILEEEANMGKIDSDLLKLFIEAKVYEIFRKSK